MTKPTGRPRGRPTVPEADRRPQFSIRVHPAYVPVIEHLMKRHGLTRSGVVEMGLRQLTQWGLEPWDGPPVPPRTTEIE